LSFLLTGNGVDLKGGLRSLNISMAQVMIGALRNPLTDAAIKEFVED
jgi:hypothetical protein